MTTFRKLLNGNKLSRRINQSRLGQWAENTDTALLIEDNFIDLKENFSYGPKSQAIILTALSPIILVSSFFYHKQTVGTDYLKQRDFMIRRKNESLHYLYE
jgi:hypothetical protein